MSAAGHPDLEHVRHGRARLTVARSGSLDDDRLTAALDAFQRGEPRSAAAVARAYLRARVVGHSPSFSWRSAKFSELIPLVTSVSAEPAITAESSQELAEALLRLREQRGATPSVAAPAEPRAPAAPAPPFSVRKAAAIAAVAVIALGVWLLVGGGGGDEADEYRAATAPAVTAIADSMDGVFGAFDVYLAGGRSEVLHEAAADAERALAEARSSLTASVPTGDGEAEVAARAAAGSVSAYVNAVTGFLERVTEFAELNRDAARAEAPALYAQTRRLGHRADALEEEVLALGIAPGDESGADHYRPAPPKELALED